MDFLLECIGFPPDHPLEDIVAAVRQHGEAAPWRGIPSRHMRLPLGGGLELRIDRDDEASFWNVLPHYQTSTRLRVAVEAIRGLPDSRFDALLYGWAAPPIGDGELELASSASKAGDGSAFGGTMLAQGGGAYRLCTYLTDARRLPRSVPAGHVLAVSIAGFALDVSYLGPDEGASDASVLERESGASIEPLGGPDEPGGCAIVSLQILRILHFENPITRARVDLIEVEAPERPLTLFVSKWQLERDGMPAPRPGMRIEGTFMFSGRIAGGLPGPRRHAGNQFG